MPSLFGRWELTDEAPPAEVVPVDPSGKVRLPAGRFVSEASYSRDGDDLVMSWRDGSALTVARFFAGGEPADLLGDDGARLPGVLVRHLAQPGPPPGREAEAVARIAASNGKASLHRSGQAQETAAGTMLLAGDLLETGEGGVLAIELRRGGSVVLGEGARLALYVLDRSSLSVLKGNFLIQAAGDGGAVTLDTPVATLRLQGMRGGLDLPDGRNLTLVHMGGTGEASLVNARGTRALKAPGTFTTATSFALEPSSVGVMDKADAESLFAAVLAAADGAVPKAAPSPVPVAPAQPAPAAPLKQALGAVAAAVKGPGTAVAAKPEAAPPPPPPPPRAMAAPPPVAPPPPPPPPKRPPGKPSVNAALSALPREKPKEKAATPPPPPPPPPTTREPAPLPPSVNAKPHPTGPRVRYFLAPDMETAQRGGIGIDMLYGGAPEEFLGFALPDGSLVRGKPRGDGST
jgi:hypothetical protein